MTRIRDLPKATIDIDKDRIYRELGTSLYTDPVMGIRELIQNGFDAYARKVDIYINIPEDRIEVFDDGHGMNEHIIYNYFFMLGRGTKVGVDVKVKPKLPYKPEVYRPYIGYKGLGRIAWQLLGSECTYTTTTVDSKEAIEFRMAEYSREIKDIYTVKKPFKHGTKVIITDLKIDKFDDDDFVHLKQFVGWLPVQFKDFKIWYEINSPDFTFKKRGFIINKEPKGVVVSFKRDEYEGKISLTEDAPFWILIKWMGIKTTRDIFGRGISGYINFTNLLTNTARDDIDSSKENRALYEKLVEMLREDLAVELNYLANKNKSAFYKIPNETLVHFAYKLPPYGDVTPRLFMPYTKWEFPYIGMRRLMDFYDTDDTIYYHAPGDTRAKYKADRAYNLLGLKSFISTGAWGEDWVFGTSFGRRGYIQHIKELDDTYLQTAGATVSPHMETVNMIKDILADMDASITNLRNKIKKLKEELEEKELTEFEKDIRKKEIEKLEEIVKKREEIKTKEITEPEEIVKHAPKRKKPSAFKANPDDYVKTRFFGRDFYIGFAKFEDKEIQAQLYLDNYLHLNVNNSFIRFLVGLKKPVIKSLLLADVISHEVAHLFESTHDEKFYAIKDAVYLEYINQIKRRFPEDFEQARKEISELRNLTEAKRRYIYHISGERIKIRKLAENDVWGIRLSDSIKKCRDVWR